MPALWFPELSVEHRPGTPFRGSLAGLAGNPPDSRNRSGDLRGAGAVRLPPDGTGVFRPADWVGGTGAAMAVLLAGGASARRSAAAGLRHPRRPVRGVCAIRSRRRCPMAADGGESAAI